MTSPDSSSRTLSTWSRLSPLPAAGELPAAYSRHAPARSELRTAITHLAGTADWPALGWSDLVDGLIAIGRTDIPLARLVEAKRELGMPDLPVYSDVSGDFTRDWVDPDDGDMPGLSVFHRDSGWLRHFWSGEMTQSDPGQDPRGAPEIDPLWAVLDMGPNGRRPDWYPSLHWAGRR